MKRIYFTIVAALFAATAHADPQWQSFDDLGPGDAALAQGVAAPFWGDNPAEWPDWLDLRAVRLPTSDGGTILVVRVPWHAPCGQYGLTVLGPVTADRTRLRLGDDFCAGDLSVVPVGGRALPDLIIQEGHVRDPATGAWERKDQRVRWSNGQWLIVLSP